MTLANATLDIGDTYSVTLSVNGGSAQTYFYSVTQTGETVSGVVTALLAIIGSDSSLTNVVDVSSNANVLTLTSHDPGLLLSTSGQASNAVAGTSVIQIASTTVSNNVALVPGQEQTTTLDLGVDHYDSGDVIHVNIGGVTIDYTVSAYETTDHIGAAIANLINNNQSASAVVSASYTDNVITLSSAGNANTNAFTASVTVDNFALHNNPNPVASTNLAVQSVAKVDTIQIGGSNAYDIGDVVKITVGGTVYSHTVTSSDTFNSIATALAGQISGNNGVTASASGSNVVITAATAGTSFTSSVEVVDAAYTVNATSYDLTHTTANRVALAQQDKVTLDSNAYDVGDVIQVSFVDASNNTHSKSVTVASGDSNASIGAAIVSALNNTGGVNVAYANGVVTFTAQTPGTGFTLSSQVNNAIYHVNAGQASDSTTTANVVAHAQTTSVTLGNQALDAGDVVNLTLSNGQTLTQTVTAGQTAQQALAALAAQVTGGNLSATAANGVMTITGAASGASFTANASITDVVVATNALTPSLVQTVQTAAAQSAAVTLSNSGGFTNGAAYSITLNVNNTVDQTFTYTVTNAALTSANTILNNLKAQITGANGVAGLTVTKSGNILVITENNPGTPFTITATENDPKSTLTASVTSPNVVARQQISQVDFGSSSFDVGDTWTLSVAGTQLPLHSVSNANVSMNSVIDATVSEINQANLGVTASRVSNGTLGRDVLQLQANSAFSTAANVNNISVTSNNPLVNVSTTAGNAVGAQVDTVNLGAGTYDVGDAITLTVGQTSASYTVQAGDSLNAIAAGLRHAINNGTPGATVTAALSGNNVTLTAATAGTAFSSSVSVSDQTALTNTATLTHTQANQTAQAQVETFNFGTASLNSQDSISVTINTHVYSVTSTATTAVGTAIDSLVTQINSANLGVTAAKVGGLLTVTANSVGTAFTASGSMTDHTAATNAGQPTDTTTTNNLVGHVQHSTVTLGNTPYDAGDVIKVTINDGANHVASYTVTGGETNADIVNALRSTINGMGLSLQASVQNGVLKLDGTSEASTFQVTAETENTGFQTNTADLATATPNQQLVLAVKQVETITFDAPQTLDIGDVYSVKIGNTTIEYVVDGTEGSLAKVLSNLKGFINIESANLGLTATSDATSIVLTASAAGTGFNFEPAHVTNALEGGNAAYAVTALFDVTANRPISVQVDTVTVNGGDLDAGDTLTITVDGVSANYQVGANDSTADALLGLKAAINASNIFLVHGVAADINADGNLILTGKSDGTSFVTSVSLSDYPFTDNVAISSATTANVEAVAQVETFNFGTQTFDPGDVIDYTAGAQTGHYTVTSTDTLDTILDAVVAAMIAANSDFTAARDGAKIVVTAATPGTAITPAITVSNVTDAAASVSNSSTDGVASTADVWTFDLGSSDWDPGDVILIKNGQTVVATITLTQVTTSADLATLLGVDPNMPAGWNATTNGNALVITGPANGSVIAPSLSYTDATDNANNTFAVDATNSVAGVSGHSVVRQVSEVDLDTTALDVGDEVLITVDSNAFTHTVEAGESKADVMADLVSQINAASLGVTASSDGLHTITLTGDAQGNSFNSSSTINNIGPDNANSVTDASVSSPAVATNSTADIWTVALTGASFDADDVVNVNINGQAYATTVTSGQTKNQIINALVSQISSDANASAANNNGVLKLTAKVGGTSGALTVTSDVTNSGTINTSSDSTLTSNVAGNAAVQQIDTVKFTTASAFTTYSITIGDTQYSYTTTSSATLNSIVNALVTRINNDGPMPVTAIKGSGGTIILTADVAGAGFTTSATGGTHTVTTAVQNAVAVTPTAQISQVDLGSANYDIGDTVAVTVNNVTYSHPVTSAETLTQTMNWLVNAINNGQSAVVASKDSSGAFDVLKLSANTAGTAFSFFSVVSNAPTTINSTTTTNINQATDSVAAVAQVDTLTFGGIGLDAGDKIDVTVAGQTVTYTVHTTDQSDSDVVDALVTLLNAKTAQTGVTASNDSGVLKLTGAANGSSFTHSASVTDVVRSSNSTTDSVVHNAQTAASPVVQVSYVTFDGGALDRGDVVSLDIDGHTFSFTVTNANTSYQDALSDLVTQIQAANLRVTAANNAGGGANAGEAANHATLTLTGASDGTTFLVSNETVTNVSYSDNNSAASSSNPTPGATATQQVATYDLPLATGGFNVGDTFTMSISGTPFEYKVAAGTTGQDAVGAALAAAITTALSNESGATATYNSNTHVLTITGTDTGANNLSSLAFSAYVPSTNSSPVNDHTEHNVQAQAQVVTVDLGASATYDAGDVVTITIKGHHYSYTVVANDTEADVQAGLISAINVQSQTDVVASAPQNSTDAVLLTAAVAGVSFTYDSAVTNAGSNNSLSADTTTSGQTAQAQQSTVTLDHSWTPEFGDTFTITVGGQDFTYVSADGDTLADVANALVDAIVNSSLTSIDLNSVTLTDQNGDFTITMDAASSGTAFTLAANFVNRAAGAADADPLSVETAANVQAQSAVAQESTVTLGGGDFDRGDVVTVSINGTPFTYTVQQGDTHGDIGQALADLVHNSAQFPVDATYGSGVVTFTAKQAGVAFNINSSVANWTEQTNSVLVDTTQDAIAHVDAMAQEVKLEVSVNTVETGDVFSFTLNGNTYSYTTQGGSSSDTVADIVNALVDQITNGSDAGVIDVTTMTTTVPGDTMILTAHTPGFAFTLACVSATVRQVGANGGNTATATTTTANADPVSAAVQISDVHFALGTHEPGDTYSITITNGVYTQTYSYVSDGTEGDFDIQQILIDQINQDNANTAVTADIDLATYDVILEGDNTGGAFTVAASITNRGVGTHADNSATVTHTQANVAYSAALAQVDTLHIGASGYNIGDVVSVTVGSSNYSETLVAGETAAQVAADLQALISSDSLVTASVSGTDLILTGKTVATPFASTLSVTDYATHTNTISAFVLTSPTASVAQKTIVDFDTTHLVTNQLEAAAHLYSLTINGTGVNYAFSSLAVGNPQAVLSQQALYSAIATQINNAGLGVTAQAIADPQDPSNVDGHYTLQLTANTAGTAFTVSNAAVQLRMNSDVLTGGLGGDSFVFTGHVSGNGDTVTDFDQSQGDNLLFVSEQFHGTNGGFLVQSAGATESLADAVTAGHSTFYSGNLGNLVPTQQHTETFAYDTSSGNLWFNGNGINPHLVATLTGAPTLDQFHIIGITI